MSIDLDRLQRQEDDLNPNNPQNEQELTAITTDYRDQPIFVEESYFTLDSENYRAEDAASFLGHYIGELGADQVLEQLGAKEHKTF